MSYILSRVIDHRHWQYRQWLAEAGSDEIQHQADALALRRDMATLLTYVRDHKITGTHSTGNMPLKAIREVTSGFVDPPVLDTTIGVRVYKLRTEYEVWPLYFLHILAQVGELLETPVGGLWRLTPAATQFLDFGSVDQTLHLLYVWWYRVNWAIADPAEQLGDPLPRDLPRITLDRLRAIPVGRRVEFEDFADALTKRAGLVWSSPATHDAQNDLRWAVRSMVVEIAESYGIVETEKRDRGPLRTAELLAFRVTRFGRLLLTALVLLSGEPE